MYEYNPSCPLSYEEYLEKVFYVQMEIIIGNEILDPSNKEQPIQRLITDEYDGFYDPRILNKHTLLLGVNTYEIEDGIFSSTKTGKFYAVTRDKVHNARTETVENEFFLTFEVKLDSTVKHFH